MLLTKPRHLVNLLQDHDKRDADVMQKKGYSSPKSDFQYVLCTQYSRLMMNKELRHEELFHTTNIVSSIEFDRDDEFFATAEVSRRIEVFSFSMIVNEAPKAHLL